MPSAPFVAPYIYLYIPVDPPGRVPLVGPTALVGGDMWSTAGCPAFLVESMGGNCAVRGRLVVIWRMIA